MHSLPGVDPFAVLGLSRDAGEAEVRARYLELVKQFPPERNPDKFREVRAAFEAAKDPLLIAQRLIEPPDVDHLPAWSDVLEAHSRLPPQLSPTLLLSLGNKAARDPHHSTATVRIDVPPAAPDDRSDAEQVP